MILNVYNIIAVFSPTSEVVLVKWVIFFFKLLRRCNKGQSLLKFVCLFQVKFNFSIEIIIIIFFRVVP